MNATVLFLVSCIFMMVFTQSLRLYMIYIFCLFPLSELYNPSSWFTNYVIKKMVNVAAVQPSSYGRTWEVCKALQKLALLSAFVSCNSYASFVLRNLPRASITRWLHAARLPFLNYKPQNLRPHSTKSNLAYILCFKYCRDFNKVEGKIRSKSFL